MPEPVRLYTPAEAAAVSGLALKAVNNVIDKRILEVAKPPAAGKRAIRRYLTRNHLLCLRLEYGLAGRLPLERRQGLFREVAARPDAKLLKADDLLFVDVGAARREVSARVRDLDEAERLIHVDKETLGGEPVFRGTRIPAYAIAVMLDVGADVDEILAGYPKLDRRKLELARLWAAAHPRRGRPKRLSDFGFTLKSTSRRRLPADPFGDAEAREPGRT
ncbi:MAG: DUF433 domain-containing protein [Caulobacteraceae bacterium]|nr:DUF433 domain-containing protein [Caulobacteraceae bacterium]